MKLSASILATLVTFFGLSLGVPAPFVESLPEPVEVTENTLVKRGNGVSCSIGCSRMDTAGFVKVSFDTSGPWANDWGRGFLDNVHSHCGSQTDDWTFWYDNGDNNAAGHGYFWIPRWLVCNDGGSSHCVEDAFWSASNPTGAIWNVQCSIY